jgi:tetratricopeptide (TPR) repeat protein
MLILAGAVGVTLFVVSRPPAPDAQPITRSAGPDPASRARQLEQSAFADLPTPSEAVRADPDHVGFAAMADSARAAFSDAAATLLQDPDPALRAVLSALADPTTRSQGLEALWTLGQGDAPIAPVALRAAAAVMTPFGDRRAGIAIERANEHNPQDVHLWRLSSYLLAEANRPGEAKGAAIIARALDHAAAGARAEAAATLMLALPLIERPGARAFVLGHLGDYAAETDDLRTALNHYREAVGLLERSGQDGALSLEASKLARIYLALGDPEAACASLRNARSAGASLSPEALAEACGPER